MLISDPLDELLPLLAAGQNKPVPDGQFMFLLDQSAEQPVNNNPDANNAPDNRSNTVEIQTDSWLELFAEQKLSGTTLYPVGVDDKATPANLVVIQDKDSALNTLVLKPRQAEVSVTKEQTTNSFLDLSSAALVQLPDGCTLLWASHASGASGFQILQPSERQFKSSDVNFTADVVPNIKAKNNPLNQPLKTMNPAFFAFSQQQEIYQRIEEQIDATVDAEAEVDMFMQTSWAAEFQQSEYQREHWFFDQQSAENTTLYYRNYFQPSAGSVGVFSLPASGFSQAQQFVFNGTLSTAGELNAG